MTLIGRYAFESAAVSEPLNLGRGRSSIPSEHIWGRDLGGVDETRTATAQPARVRDVVTSVPSMRPCFSRVSVVFEAVSSAVSPVS